MHSNQGLTSRIREDLFTGTDLVKMIVLVSFSATSLMLTTATPMNAQLLSPLVYCIPVLLVALWFPRQAFATTAFLVAGFVIIRVYLSNLVLPSTRGDWAADDFFWFRGRALFRRMRTAARCRRIGGYSTGDSLRPGLGALRQQNVPNLVTTPGTRRHRRLSGGQTQRCSSRR